MSLTNIELTQTGKEEQELFVDPAEKKKAVYALNLCTVSVSQIIDYNDIYVLEQEYDAILNNLNLQNFIKDEALLKIIKQILDTITFFRIQEKEKKFIEKRYQLKIEKAIWSVVPQSGLSGLSMLLSDSSLSRSSFIKVAFFELVQVGICYMNYRKNKNQYLDEKEEQEWALQRSAIEQFHGLRRELFETAWRLSDTYKIDDVLRLTEKQISNYNAVLIDRDPLRRY